jgi:hypothetical protein
LHYHAGGIDTCWRLGGEIGAAKALTSAQSILPKTGKKFIKSSLGDDELVSVGF